MARASNTKRVESTRSSRSLAERRLDAEQRKLAAGTSTSFVVFQATAGTTYEIAVSGAAGATGTITGRLIQAPANDQFAAATVLSGKDPARLTGTTEGATGEPSEPDHATTSVATGCSSATALASPGR